MDSSERAILEEQRKIRRLTFLVDLTCSILYQDSSLTLPQAVKLVEDTERAVLRMFPDKQSTYDLVLRPRFDRILSERWPLQPTGSVN